MSSLRPHFWTHQEINGNQRGDGGTSVWTSDYWTSIGFLVEGMTLLRTVVSGFFSVGVTWDPAGSVPFSDALSSVSFDFMVYVQDDASGVITPPEPTNTFVDSHLVWRSCFTQTSQAYVQGVGDGALWTATFSPPMGPASESKARRGPVLPPDGSMYAMWLLQSGYTADLAAFTAGYSVGGTAWNWQVAGQISVDQLWEGTA